MSKRIMVEDSVLEYSKDRNFYLDGTPVPMLPFKSSFRMLQQLEISFSSGATVISGISGETFGLHTASFLGKIKGPAEKTKIVKEHLNGISRSVRDGV